MNKLQYGLIWLLAITACSLENEIAPITVFDSIETIKVSAPNFDVQNISTKTSINVSDQEATFAWSANDTIGVFPTKGYQVAFPMISGAGSSSAAFSGGGWALKIGDSYASYYPFQYMNKDASNIPIDWTGQTQIGNNSTANLGNYDYMAADLTEPSSGEVTFSFKHLGSLLKFTLIVPKPGNYKSMTVSTEEKLFATLSTLNILSSPAVLSNKTFSNSLSIGISDIQTSSENQSVNLYMICAPTDLSNRNLNIKLTDTNGNSYYATVSGKKMDEGKAYSYTATLEEPSELDYYTDLSTNGNYNCYIINSNGKYRFKINNYDGDTAFLLWNENGETDITDVKIIDSFICFTKPSFNKGNAVISLSKDGTIVWSWHIWTTDTPNRVKSDSGLYWMDRNLGATSTSAGDENTYGLLYIPGNPFPFPGPKYNNLFSITSNPSVPEGWYVASGYGFYTDSSMPDPSKPMHVCSRTDVFGNSVFFKSRYNQCPEGFSLPGASTMQNLVGYEPTIVNNGVYPMSGLYIPCIYNMVASSQYGCYLCSGIYNTVAVDTWVLLFYEGCSKQTYCQGPTLLPIRCYSYDPD